MLHSDGSRAAAAVDCRDVAGSRIHRRAEVLDTCGSPPTTHGGRPPRAKEQVGKFSVEVHLRSVWSILRSSGDSSWVENVRSFYTYLSEYVQSKSTSKSFLFGTYDDLQALRKLLLHDMQRHICLMRNVAVPSRSIGKYHLDYLSWPHCRVKCVRR